jgi:adenosylcobinamide amidohydrolase
MSRFHTLGFPGADLDRGSDYYLLRLKHPMQFLSSAPLGEGFLEVQWVLSQQVDISDPLPTPLELLRWWGQRRGIPPGQDFVGLLTAVEHEDIQVVTCTENGATVTTLATVGAVHGSSPRQDQLLDFDVPAEGSDPSMPTAGTINTVSLVDAYLSPGAMVRASTLATEAKTLALVEAGLHTREGYISTGTATDATVLGHTRRGRRFEYAGMATLVGWLLGHATYEAVKQGLEAFQSRRRESGA